MTLVTDETSPGETGSTVRSNYCRNTVNWRMRSIISAGVDNVTKVYPLRSVDYITQIIMQGHCEVLLGVLSRRCSKMLKATILKH